MGASIEPPSLRIATAADDRPPHVVAMPVLAGDPVDRLEGFGPGGAAGNPDDPARWRSGVIDRAIGPSLERAAFEAYRELLATVRDLRAVRIWNYLPGINEAGPDGLENYQAFCRGRSLAFEQAFGANFHPHLPAASAVGTPTGGLTLGFVACDGTIEHRENPRQVPAYRYPPAYGPRAPTFARATIVTTAAARTVFFAGTSAIVGHETIAPDDTAAQLRCTVDNLRRLGETCGLPSELGAGTSAIRRFRVYLRHATDYPATAAALKELLLRPDDRVTYVQADICRRPLNIEIEATITTPAVR